MYLAIVLCKMQSISNNIIPSQQNIPILLHIFVCIKNLMQLLLSFDYMLLATQFRTQFKTDAALIYSVHSFLHYYCISHSTVAVSHHCCITVSVHFFSTGCFILHHIFHHDSAAVAFFLSTMLTKR